MNVDTHIDIQIDTNIFFVSISLVYVKYDVLFKFLISQYTFKPR